MSYLALLRDITSGDSGQNEGTRVTDKTDRSPFVGSVSSPSSPIRPEQAVAVAAGGSPATPEQAAELRALIAVILAGDSDADRAEAQTIAEADPENALVSFRLLAGGRANNDPHDTRRCCTQCRNLSRQRCMAAYRGEDVFSAPRDYSPVVDLPQHCPGYQPGPDDPDQRPVWERWPSMAAPGGAS
jgi:hypothetical protein